MATAANGHLWWDREVDSTGNLIREDVRAAGHDVWKQACLRTRAMLGDSSAAADLMECAVAQVSRYLDRRGIRPSQIHGLLLTAFCRGLRRYASKLQRLEFVGGVAELSSRTIDNSWCNRIHTTLDLQNILKQLSAHNAAVLKLKIEGFNWNQIAACFDTSVPAIRNSFWREIAKLTIAKRSRRENAVPSFSQCDSASFRSARGCGQGGLRVA